MEEMEKLRREISDVDAALVPLLLRRMEISGRIGAYKRARAIPVRDEAREQAVLECVATQAGAEMGEYLREIYLAIMAASRRYQSDRKDGT